MTKQYFLIFILTFSFVNEIIGQDYNRPTPTDHPPYEFIQNISPTNTSHYLIGPFRVGSSSTNIGNMSLINKDGYIDWYVATLQKFYLDFKYHPQHHLFTYAATGSDAKFFVLDTLFNLVDSIKPINGSITDIHEFIILDNGNYVIMGSKDSIMDLSSFIFDGTQGSDSTNVKGCTFQEFDSSHNLVFEWNSNDHIHPTEFIDSYGYDSTKFDYVHGNAIEEDSDGNFLVSFRGLDAIYKINKSTGNTMWILGGKSNQFTFINDNPGFSGQHDIRRLPNGNISLFDNANNQAPPKRSRGKEYLLDTTNMTCTKVYQYTHSPSFFARAMGSFQTMANNDRIVGYGLDYRPDPSFVHVDDNDNIITEVHLKDSIVTYRTFASELNFNLNNPEIICSPGSGTATLTAPSGYTKYAWSTGETSQSIIVSDTGTYQVWVNYGIGMLGSIPKYIADIQNPCGVVGIENLTKRNEEKVISNIYDLLGREIKKPKIAQIYVVRYTDGSAELIHWNNSITNQ